jgi:Fe-S-cluster-containing hydrogenase component 2
MLRVELSPMSATPTAVYPNRCLLQRNYDSECKYCQDACPISAVKFDNRAPSVNADQCFGCGLCLVACPVECFETVDWSELSLVSALEHIGRPIVEIACKSHPAPAIGNEASPVVVINTCLGAVSPGLWFELGLKYSLKIRLEYCSACPMGKGASYARQSVEQANAWLKSCGQAATPDRPFIIKETWDDPDESRRRVVISAERPIINRRDFLFGFARSSGPANLALKKLPFEFGGEKTDNKVAPHIPAWLRRMADIYPNTIVNDVNDGCKGTPEETCIHWPTLSVADNCVACESCSLNCPSAALKTKVIEGNYQHLFTPGLCVACGLCAQVCPTGALTRSYISDKQPFEERVMVERQVGTCPKCGRPSLRVTDRLCFCCATEPTITSLLDSARSFLLHA